MKLFSKISSSREVGFLVRKTRQEAKITQKTLAMLCNVGVRFISDLEGGKETLHLGKVLRVLENLGLEVRAFKRGGFKTL